ncbi:hypothetical protein NPIL_614001 [Nephila pilipes]|uniref:Uncharacterized protein n=1 Tax=Nephila pilipes TaxID=299642 RepID=A0A8X6PUN0_NEPPI|nr:hypothetical protein NPIL_614001 [Nephila pilipes]
MNTDYGCTTLTKFQLRTDKRRKDDVLKHFIDHRHNTAIHQAVPICVVVYVESHLRCSTTRTCAGEQDKIQPCRGSSLTRSSNNSARCNNATQHHRYLCRTKYQIIARCSESKAAEIRCLLASESLGDQKPSELLRAMKRLAENHNIDDS